MIRACTKTGLTMCLLACLVPLAGCPSPIIRFSGPVPQAALNLNGTYRIAVTDPSVDTSQLPPDPTVVISGGLLTQIGDIVVTPTNFSNSGNNFVWTSAANVSLNGINYKLTVMLNADLQPDNTLTGTFSATGQSATIAVTLTRA